MNKITLQAINKDTHAISIKGNTFIVNNGLIEVEKQFEDILKAHGFIDYIKEEIVEEVKPKIKGKK